ncbi:carboxypeptidase-like regulatory domain-containing protein [Chitinophaga filiformis]|uniref:carboxypeptidase-like regulatory domain-containing protein n=1 Tax=Chitinophaga filiformis TaxID=104663 RepID=UPI001F1CBCFC|nr:carboxypeptidase-like regulatory domain-containing protein [Chitinophaga filiformis]MCF6402276.1 carboxypeptidase-like regulatory domain-containing protein [Chitinophaga filiformis]
MKKSSVIISIPTPCHESWDAMTPADKGRFCQSCQKTVTDFSGMSNQQIISYLKSRRGKVCGRFHADQLNKELSMPANSKKQPFASIAAMVAALSIAIPTVEAKSKAEKIQLAPERSGITPQQTDTLPRIRGIVIDSISKAVVPGAIIILKGQEPYTLTDSAGKFELQIPENCKDKPVTLKVRLGEDVSKEFVVSVNDTRYLEFPLQISNPALRDATFMGAVAHIEAMPLTQKPNAWQRFKYKVSNLFR